MRVVGTVTAVTAFQALDVLAAWAQRHPGRAFALHEASSAVLYLWASRFPPFTPWPIAPTRLDALVPLVPLATPFYLSFFLIVPALVLTQRRQAYFGRVFLTGFLYMMVNLAITVLVPTRIEPFVVPAAAAADPENVWLALLLHTDRPNAVCPSGHFGLPLVLTLALCSAGAPRCTKLAFGAWALMMGLTVLLTKQHYTPDLAAAAALVLAVWWLLWRLRAAHTLPGHA